MWSRDLIFETIYLLETMPERFVDALFDQLPLSLLSLPANFGQIGQSIDSLLPGIASLQESIDNLQKVVSSLTFPQAGIPSQGQTSTFTANVDCCEELLRVLTGLLPQAPVAATVVLPSPVPTNAGVIPTPATQPIAPPNLPIPPLPVVPNPPSLPQTQQVKLWEPDLFKIPQALWPTPPSEVTPPPIALPVPPSLAPPVFDLPQTQQNGVTPPEAIGTLPTVSGVTVPSFPVSDLPHQEETPEWVKQALAYWQRRSFSIVEPVAMMPVLPSMPPLPAQRLDLPAPPSSMDVMGGGSDAASLIDSLREATAELKKLRESLGNGGREQMAEPDRPEQHEFYGVWADSYEDDVEHPIAAPSVNLYRSVSGGSGGLPFPDKTSTTLSYRSKPPIPAVDVTGAAARTPTGLR